MRVASILLCKSWSIFLGSFVALSLLLSVQSLAQVVTPDGTVIVGDKEWRQVTDTVGLNWEQVATVCDVDTGLCSGSLDGVDFSDWKWATAEEVGALFAVLTPYPGGISSYIEVDSVWAPEFFTYFSPTFTGSFVSQLVGASRTLSDQPGNAYWPFVRDDAPLTADLIGMSQQSVSLPPTSTRGFWLYRPVSNQLIRVSFSGFFDEDPSGVLGGDLSYSGTVVYDPNSPRKRLDDFGSVVSQYWDIITYSVNIGGTTLTFPGSVTNDFPTAGLEIQDGIPPSLISDAIRFQGGVLDGTSINGYTVSGVAPNLGAGGLSTAFSDIGVQNVADVYLNRSQLFNNDFWLDLTLDGTSYRLRDQDEIGFNATTVTFAEIAPVSYQFTGSILSAQGIYSGIPFGAAVSATYTFDGNAVGNTTFENNREDFDNSAAVNRDEADLWRATLQVDDLSLATIDGQRLAIVADTGGVFSEGLLLTSQRGLSNGTVDVSVPFSQIGFFGDLYDGLGVLTGDIQTDVIRVLDTLDLGSLTSQVTEWQTLSETGGLLGSLIWTVTSIERADQGQLDAEPPAWSVPADITVSAAGIAGAAVTYTATVSDNVAVTSQSCAPASGSVFPIGTTTVTCVASDAAGNTASASFTVTVIDDQPPSWSIPGDISVIATSLSGAEVNYTAVASDNVGVVSASCVPASATIFPVGSTVVTCTATDAAGNTAGASFNVVVGVNTASTSTLIDGIAGLGLPSGVEASLQSTLGQIDRLINDSNPDNDSAVCDKLVEFLIKVGEREADGSLTTEQSSSVRVFAEAMQATFGCIP